ncbi:Apolipoprotein L3, partial [Galemys pyrenaicus]
SNDFLEFAIEYMLNTLSREDLLKLQTDAQVWEEFVAEAHLSRAEADVIRQVLSYRITEDEMEDKKEQEFRESFLKDYPQVKRQLEEHIAQLYALADKADKVHKDCTISNVVASSTGIVSGVLTILGLSLAPVTAGVSLALTATGMGLGTAAAVTAASTSIVEHVNMSTVEAKANTLSAEINVEDMFKEVLRDNGSKVFSIGNKLFGAMEDIRKTTRAIKLIQSKPHLVARASRLMSGGKISARSAKEVEKAFGGTALAMTKGTRMVSAVSVGITVLMDVVSLVQNSKVLHEGAKTQSAENVRQKARELENKLEELCQIYESLTL